MCLRTLVTESGPPMMIYKLFVPLHIRFGDVKHILPFIVKSAQEVFPSKMGLVKLWSGLFWGWSVQVFRAPALDAIALCGRHLRAQGATPNQRSEFTGMRGGPNRRAWRQKNGAV